MKTATLDEVCELIVDCPHSTPVWTENGALVFRSNNIRNGRLDLSQKSFTTEAEYQKRVTRAVPTRGDLIITREAPMGEVAIIPEGVHGCLGQRVVLLRPNANVVSGRYMVYALISPEVQHEIRAHEGAGSTVSNLRIPALKALAIPLPSLEEQRAIAHILGTLDDKIELNRRMNATLEAIARALFKSWFVDFDPVRAKAEGRDPGLPPHLGTLFPNRLEDSELGEIPAGWRLGVLDDLVERALGGDWGTDEGAPVYSEPARCIRGADIPDLQCGGTGKMPVRYLKPASLAKRRLSADDLVVEISGGSPAQSTGRAVLVSSGLLSRLDAPLVCSNFCRMVTLKSPVHSRFLYLWLRYLYSNDEFLQFENGTTGIKNFAYSLFASSFNLCIPPTKLVQEFDGLVSPLFDRVQANAGESDTLAALRDALLPKLISGELRVKDAERVVEAV